MKRNVILLFALMLCSFQLWGAAASDELMTIERRYEVKQFDERRVILLPERPLANDTEIQWEATIDKKTLGGKSDAFIKLELVTPSGSPRIVYSGIAGQQRKAVILVPKGHQLRIEMYAGMYQLLFAKSGARVICNISYPELAVTMTELPQRFAFQFTANGLTVVDRWVWNFGDGEEAQGNGLTHTYPTPGRYTIHLSGLKGNQEIQSYKKEILVPDSVEIQPTLSPLEGVIAFDISARANLVLHYGQKAECIWDFGDGSSPVIGDSATHRYTAVGQYKVTLTVRSEDERINSNQTWNVTAKPISIVNRASVTPQQGPASLTILAKAQPTWEGSPVRLHYAWDFGDGTQSDKAQTIHVYNKPGDYLVTLRVWDEYHPEIELPVLKFPVHVIPPALRIDPVAYPAEGSAPLKVRFFPNLWVEGSPTEIVFQWNFGDGTTSTEPEPTHIYRTPGVYNVVLVVKEKIHNVTISAVLRTKVLPREPKADGEIKPTSGKAPLTIECKAAIKNDTDNPELIARWDFGDGQNATGAEVQHTYDQPGTYPVTLTVWYNDNPQLTQEKHFEVVVTSEK